MSRVKYVQPDPLKFDGSNYQAWSSYHVNYFRACGPNVEQVLVASISPSNSMTRDEKVMWEQLNARIVSLLFGVVDDHVQQLIMYMEDAHQIWSTLKRMYDKITFIRKIIHDARHEDDSSSSEESDSEDQEDEQECSTSAASQKPVVPG